MYIALMNVHVISSYCETAFKLVLSQYLGNVDTHIRKYKNKCILHSCDP